MDSVRLTRTPRHDAASEAGLNVLAAIYALALRKYQGGQAVVAAADHDDIRESDIYEEALSE
jgi:hypothetical protein